MLAAICAPVFGSAVERAIETPPESIDRIAHAVLRRAASVRSCKPYVLGREHTFTGMDETPVVFVEWKVPSFAFAERRVQEGYFAEATHIIHEMSGGRQPKDRIM
ncbi:hypothetical protein [Burkholderia sp. Ac-20353]|uniref:hypothetical protein n=1 Tax=Burkholderia sp. Ac-20353 TaxID=2703894 RepID=UPI00197B9229|nr:hypothetical protein [Burkholderia sp. Ac-20353]MBN3788597.1 hypothetical protein [Burkholderia sp. Ac-20353]